MISTHKDLADKLGITPQRLSTVKRKKNYSQRLLEDLANITGIPATTLATGSITVINNRFKKFFAAQRQGENCGAGNSQRTQRNKRAN